LKEVEGEDAGYTFETHAKRNWLKKKPEMTQQANEWKEKT